MMVAPRRRVEGGFPEVRVPFRTCDVGFEGLELAFADDFEGLSVGPDGGVFIVVDRDPGFVVEAAAEFPGDGDAVVEGRVPEGNEGNDVYGADPRVSALVLFKVDGRDGRFGRLHERVLDGLGGAGQAHHQAVVVLVCA